MSKRRPSTQSTPAMVDRVYSNSEYDFIKIVADNIDDVSAVGEFIESGNLTVIINNEANIVIVVNAINEIITVTGIADDVVTVANISNDIVTITTNIDDILRVRQSIDEVVRVATSADNLDRVYASIDNLDRVYASIDNIDSVLLNINNIDIVANNISSVVTTSTNIADIITVTNNIAAVLNVSTNMADVLKASVFVDEIHDAVTAAQLSEANALSSANASAASASASQSSANASEASNQASAANAALTAADVITVASDKADVATMRDEVEADRAEVKANTALVESDKLTTEGYKNDAEDALEAVNIAIATATDILIGDNDIGDYENNPTFQSIMDYAVFGRGTQNASLWRVNPSVTLPYTVDSTTYVHPSDDTAHLVAYSTTAQLYSYTEEYILAAGQTVIQTSSELTNFSVLVQNLAGDAWERLVPTENYTFDREGYELTLLSTYPTGSKVLFIFNDIGQLDDAYIKKAEASNLYGDHNKQANRGTAGSHPATAISTTDGNTVQAKLEGLVNRSAGIGSSVYEGTGVSAQGNYVQNGDTVTAGATHLIVLINGKTEEVAISPVASGAVSLLTETSATIGGIPVEFKSRKLISFSTLDDAVNSENLYIGMALDIKERVYGNGGGALWDVVPASSVTPNGVDIIQCTGVTSLALKIRLTQTLYAKSIGCGSNDAGSLQVTEFQRLFELSKDDLVTKVILPDGEWFIDNSTGPVSVGGNCTYEHEGVIIFNDNSQRVFETTNTDNINWHVKLESTNESTTGFLGGGYVRFENCNNLQISKWKVSKHAWDGLKLVKCSDSNVFDGFGEYGKSTAVTLEGCDNVNVFRNALNKNGRNSSDDSFADMPTGWSGTLVGRGVTLVAHSDGTPCTNCDVYNNEVKLNSEYGIRSFGDGTLVGNVDCDIHDNDVVDNGHPAGTYGGYVAKVGKGVDILINGSSLVDSSQMRVIRNGIKRSLGFGIPLSIAGTDCEGLDNRIKISGAAKNVIEAIQLYNTTGVQLKGNRSWGADQHVLIASGNVDCEIVEEVSKDCLRFLTGIPTGDNLIARNRAKHRDTLATSGDLALRWSFKADVLDNTFDGFYRGIETSGTPDGMLARNKTVNTVDVGFRNNTINSPLLKQQDNNFDSPNPFGKSTVIYESNSPRSGGISTAYTIPTEGYYVRGHIVFDTQPDAVSNNRIKIGWFRLVTGTGHVVGTDWQEMWVPITSTP